MNIKNFVQVKGPHNNNKPAQLLTNKEHRDKIIGTVLLRLNNTSLSATARIMSIQAVKDAIAGEKTPTSDDNYLQMYNLLTEGELKESLKAVCQKSFFHSSSEELSDLKEFLKDAEHAQTYIGRTNTRPDKSLGNNQLSSNAAQVGDQRRKPGKVTGVNKTLMDYDFDNLRGAAKVVQQTNVLRNVFKHFNLQPIEARKPLTENEFKFLLQLNSEVLIKDDQASFNAENIFSKYLDSGLLDQIPHPIICSILLQYIKDLDIPDILTDFVNEKNSIAFSNTLFSYIKDSFSKKVFGNDVPLTPEGERLEYHINRKILIEQELNGINQGKPEEQAKTIADVVKFAVQYSEPKILLKIPVEIFTNENKDQLKALCQNITTHLSGLGPEHYTAIQQFVHTTVLRVISGLSDDKLFTDYSKMITSNLSSSEIKLQLEIFTRLMLSPATNIGKYEELSNKLKNLYKKGPDASKKYELTTSHKKEEIEQETQKLGDLNGGNYNPNTVFSYIYKTEDGFGRIPSSMAILFNRNYTQINTSIQSLSDDVAECMQYIRSNFHQSLAQLMIDDEKYNKGKDTLDVSISRVYDITDTLSIAVDGDTRNELQIIS